MSKNGVNDLSSSFVKRTLEDLKKFWETWSENVDSPTLLTISALWIFLQQQNRCYQVLTVVIHNVGHWQIIRTKTLQRIQYAWRAQFALGSIYQIRKGQFRNLKFRKAVDDVNDPLLFSFTVGPDLHNRLLSAGFRDGYVAF